MIENIQHHIYLYRHDLREDATQLGDVVKKANVVVPEGTRWNSSTLNIWKRVSRGYLGPTQGVGELKLPLGLQESQEHLMGLLFGTRKVITKLDLPAGHTLLRDLDAALKAQYQAVRTLAEPSPEWSGKITIYDKYRRMWSKTKEKREDYMVGQAEKSLPQVIRENPGLRSFDPVEVLWPLGCMHKTVAEKLQNKGHAVKVTSEPDPYPMSYSFQAENTDPDKDLDDDLLAKAMLDAAFLEIYRGIHRQARLPYWQLLNKAITIVGQVNPSDIPNILNRAAYANLAHFEAYLKGFFTEVAQGAGIELPEKK